ncbi:MAG: single-stranded-DNA-specific exonuclease RecJ [Bdellovibrionota bacterium]
MSSGEYVSGPRKLWGIHVGDEDSPLESAQEIRNYLDCHPVVARLLWNRGVKSIQQLERFLHPELNKLPDPFSIIDMQKAVSRLVKAVLSEERIAVYGDYDVDGTCGASLLVDFFHSLGIEVIAYQPNRFTEGYGVHSGALERLIDQGASVIITVDCGITAVEPARLAKDRGVDLIILDHHKVAAQLPQALAVVDPQRPEDESGLQNLCGAGLAFFFAMGLRTELRIAGYFTHRQEPNLVRLLDLVAVATVADVVDIRGVNRILVTHGLRVLARSPRPGFKAILEAAKVQRPTAMHCGFVLGPRINAAGRLQSARAAFDLLTCRDLDKAKALAQELEQINLARRQTQDRVHAQAREQALKQLQDPRWQSLSAQIPAAALGPWPRALVLAAPEEESEAWHEGVVGIVASKIVEEFGRPAFVLALKEGSQDALKGSVRSISKIDILAAISAESVACHLLNYGGHAHAGGVSLSREKLVLFMESLNLHMAMTTLEEQFRREQRFDAEVGLSEIDGRLVEELQMLEPFGHQFPEPVFKVANVAAADVKVMKEKHLKLRLEGKARLEAVWFNCIQEGNARLEMDRLQAGNPCSLWISPQWNEWQGTKRLQLQVRHAELT